MTFLNFSSSSESEEDEEEYTVEKICDKGVDEDGKTVYLLKWKGWTKPTWEFKENCNCTELIKDFEKELLDDEKRQKR